MGGDPPAPTTNESMANVLAAYQQYLPGIMNATAKTIPSIENAKLQSAQTVSPGYAQLNTDMFSKYGPQLAQIGSDINAQNAMNQAKSDTAVLKGPGSDLVRQALETAKIADPEYYSSRAAMSQGLNNLLGSINLNGLSGSERAEVERGLAQQNSSRGNLNTPSQISTVENATMFGNALQNKRNALSQALQVGAGALPGFKSGVDVLQQATGRPSAMNLGDTKFTGVAPVGADSMSMGQNVLGTTAGFQNQANQINSQRRDTLDRVNGTMSSLPSYS